MVFSFKLPWQVAFFLGASVVQLQSSTPCHHAFAAPSPTCRLNVDLANNFLPSRPANVPAYNLAMPPPQPALNAPGMVPC